MRRICGDAAIWRIAKFGPAGAPEQHSWEPCSVGMDGLDCTFREMADD
jgi:hypothetical protein